MLKTALKPKWIGLLVFSLLISTAFVLLSKWQFDQAESRAPVAETITENPVPLQEHFTTETPLLEDQADQMVTLSGTYQAENTAYIQDRLNDGVNGYWVATALEVDGAEGNIIPVVRGWAETLEEARAASTPQGNITIEGRLLPPDAPEVGSRETPDVYNTLSTAELINIWDEPSYSAVVVAFDVENAAGSAITAADQQLQSVYVGPQPQETQLNLLNVFYAVEWVFFAGFAIFLWWHLVRGEYRKELAEAQADEEWAQQWYREQGYVKEDNQS